MTPATPWTEMTAPATPYFEGIASSGEIEGFALFGFAIPISNGSSFADATTAYTEMSIPATAHTEMTVTSTPWTEFAL